MPWKVKRFKVDEEIPNEWEPFAVALGVVYTKSKPLPVKKAKVKAKEDNETPNNPT